MAGIAGYVVEHLAKGFTLIIRAVGIADEIEIHLLLFQHDLLNTQLFAISPEGNHTDEFLGHLRNIAKTVLQTIAIGSQSRIEVVAVGEIVELSIKQHTLGIVRHILVGELHLDIRFEGSIIHEE